MGKPMVADPDPAKTRQVCVPLYMPTIGCQHVSTHALVLMSGQCPQLLIGCVLCFRMHRRRTRTKFSTNRDTCRGQHGFA
jgi:hypothetical protein